MWYGPMGLQAMIALSKMNRYYGSVNLAYSFSLCEEILQQYLPM